MDFDNDNLKFQHLAGGNLLDYPPLYSRDGNHILFINKNAVNVYSAISCQFVRKLECSNAPLIAFEFELRDDNTLITCSAAGEVFSWEWKTGVLKNTLCIPPVAQNSAHVTNFNLINVYGKSDLAHAFVCFKIANETVKWRILSRSNNTFINVPCDLRLTMKKPLVAVDTKNFPNLVVAQSHYVFFVDYSRWTSVRLMNPLKVPITALKMHPSEECVATGDEYGKIFLWRQFHDQKTVKNTLHHWHHTKVTSICFTVAGANFYSSGEESVLVKWHIENPQIRQFIPRTAAEIRHIIISPDNAKVVACLNDNSVQFIGTENSVHQSLQEFTYIVDNNTENCKYPTGLRLNPRNNSLVLNGRVGSLQFYNTYTKSLLYNVNIVNQNLLSKEREKILYNINVTKAAFNIDWMATGEVFNDEEHLPEIRLKFWKYQEETQNYSLNTNIELPHEGGFKAIEFSNDYQVENLLCATVGEDNIIRMWSLEDSDNIYNNEKTWYCIAQNTYKDFPVDSISFSQDGSLLAAGYGNTLCIYKSDNLKLKAALTGANGLDGTVTKAQISISSKNIAGNKTERVEKRKKLIQLFTNTLETNEENLIKELQKTLNDTKPFNYNVDKQTEELDDKKKTSLYKKILQMHELNLFQKALLFQKLGIACKVQPQMEIKLAEYLGKLFEKKNVAKRLQSETHRLNFRQRFKAKYRLQNHIKQQKQYDDNITKNLVPILSLMNLGSVINIQSKPKKDSKTTQQNKEISEENIVPPKPTMCEISHVQFAAGEYAHLVVVCTERRILIWNLLTLRLQAVLKLSVKHLTFDPQTNLVAVVTKNNELHLFQPNVPLPIYQRYNIPKVHGIAWIPRRYPKQRSINVDWQAQSTLYFLNEDQEIIYLSSPYEKEPDVPVPIVFDNAARETISYTTFGTYATKSVSDKQTASRQSGPIVWGNNDRTAVKQLIDMSAHTMLPMSMLCEDILKSMVKSIDSQKTVNDGFQNSNTDEDALTTRLNGGINGFGGHSDDEEDEKDDNATDGDTPMTNGSFSIGAATNNIRKDLMKKTEELKRKSKYLHTSESNHLDLPAAIEDVENKLRCMAMETITLNL